MIRKSVRQLSNNEFVNITKQLPSTNPLRSPTPDVHSRKEKICSTQSPGFQLTDRTNNLKKQKNASVHNMGFSDQKLPPSELAYQLNLKDKQIAALSNENEQLRSALEKVKTKNLDENLKPPSLKEKNENNLKSPSIYNLNLTSIENKPNSSETKSNSLDKPRNFSESKPNQMEINRLALENERILQELNNFKLENLKLREDLESMIDMKDKVKRGGVDNREDYERSIQKLANELAESNQSLIRMGKEIEEGKKLKSGQVNHDDFLKLKSVLEAKLNELEDWKFKCAQYEARGFQNENIVHQDLNKLKDVLDGKIRENQVLQSQINDLKIKQTASPLKRPDLEMDGYQQKVKVLLDEMQLVNEALNKKNSDNYELLLICNDLREKLHNKADLEKSNDSLIKLVEELKKENDSLKLKRNGFSEEEKINLAKKIKALEDKIVLLVDELERVNQSLKAKNQAFSELQSENKRLAEYLAQKSNDLENQELERVNHALQLKNQAFSELQSENKRLAEYLAQKSNDLENQELERVNHALHVKSQAFFDLQSENKRLAEFLAQKSNDLGNQELERVNHALKAKNQAFSELQAENKRLAEYLAPKSNDFDIQELERINRALKIKNQAFSDLQAENKRLVEYLAQKSNELDTQKNIENVISDYKVQIERISNDLYEKTRNLEFLNGKYNILQNNYEGEKKENDRKEAEIRNWRAKFDDLLRNKGESEENNKLRQLLAIKIHENEDLAGKIKQLANVIIEKEENENNLRAQLADKNNLYLKRTTDADYWRKKFESTLSEFESLRAEPIKKGGLPQTQIETIFINNNQIDKLNEELAEQTKEINRLNSELNRKNYELVNLSNQLENISKSKGENDETSTNKVKQILAVKLRENEDLANKLKKMADILVEKEENEKNLRLQLKESSLSKFTPKKTTSIDDSDYWRKKYEAISLENEAIRNDLIQNKKDHSLLITEIENWKLKYSNLERSTNNNIEIKIHIDSLERELADAKLRQAEKERIIEIRNREIVEIKEKFLIFSNNDLEPLKNRVNSLESDKFALLNEKSLLFNDIERLENDKRDLLRKNKENLEKIKDLGVEVENLRDKLFENDRQSVDKRSLEISLMERAAALAAKQTEVDKLHGILNKKEEEFNKLKVKVAESEGRRSSELAQLRENLSSFTSKQELESHKLQSLQTENELLSQTINSLTREKNDLRTTILELESKFFSQNNEIERLKRSNEELGIKLIELGALNEAQHELLIEKEQEMMIVIHEKEVEVIEVRQRLMDMETSKKEEIKRARESLTHSQIKHEHEKRRSQNFSAEKEMLNNNNETLRKDRDEFRAKNIEKDAEISKLTFELRGLSTRFEEALHNLVLLMISHEAQRDINLSKEEEYAKLMENYSKALNEKTIQEIKMKESISETRQKHEHERKKSASFFAEKEQLSQSIEQISREKIKLDTVKQELLLEIKNSEDKKREEIEKNQLLLTRILLMAAEIERLHTVIEKREKDDIKLRKEEELRKEYEEKIQRLLENKKREIESLNSSNEAEVNRLLGSIKSQEENFNSLMIRSSKERDDFIQRYEQTMRETIAKNINDMNQIHQSEILNFEARLNDYHQTAEKYRIELEKLTNVLSTKHDEVEGWREKVAKIEAQRLAELDELRNHLEVLKNSVVHSSNVEQQAERIAYETNIVELKKRIVEKNSDVEILMNQKAELVRECERLKDRLRELDLGNGSEIIKLREIKEKHKFELTFEKENVVRLEGENRRVLAQLKQIELTCEQLREEIENLNNLISEKKRENIEIQKRYSDLETTMTETRISHNTSILPDFNLEKVLALQRENQELERSRDEYRGKVQASSMEIVEMNNKLIEKIQEIDKMKQKYQESLSNIHNLESRLLEKLKEEEVFIS